jgi:YHS domain-containing protein
MLRNILMLLLILALALTHWGCQVAYTPVPEPLSEKEPAVIAPTVLPHQITDAEIDQYATCPVSGNSIKICKDTPSYEYKDKVYYFCGPDCSSTFYKDTDKYAK